MMISKSQVDRMVTYATGRIVRFKWLDVATHRVFVKMCIEQWQAASVQTRTRHMPTVLYSANQTGPHKETLPLYTTQACHTADACKTTAKCSSNCRIPSSCWHAPQKTPCCQVWVIQGLILSNQLYILLHLFWLMH